MSVLQEVSSVLDHLCEKKDKKNHSPGRKGAISAAMSDAIKLLLQGYEIKLNPYHPAGCVLNWYYGPHPDAMTEKKKTYDAKAYGILFFAEEKERHEWILREREMVILEAEAEAEAEKGNDSRKNNGGENE